MLNKFGAMSVLRSKGFIQTILYDCDYGYDNDYDYVTMAIFHCIRYYDGMTMTK